MGISTNAFGDLFLKAQHQVGKSTLEGDEPAVLVSYIASFDATTASMAILGEDVRSGVLTNSGEYVTFGEAGDALGNGQVFDGIYDTRAR